MKSSNLEPGSQVQGDTASRERSARAGSDRRTRRVAFWVALAIMLVFWAAGLFLEDRYATQLIYANKKDGRLYSRPTPFGSYGLHMTRMARPEGLRRVFLLGNSVYQSCGIVEGMQSLAYQEGRPVLFYNLAMAGVSAYDYLTALGKVLPEKPDLVVISFINLAFTPDWTREDELPRFRTDADLMALDPEVVARLPWSFYAREFSPAQWWQSLAGTIWRFSRQDLILGHHLKGLAERRRWLPDFILSHLNLPELNLVAEWIGRSRPGPRLGGPARPYASNGRLIDEMVRAARRSATPVLFLRQESGPNYLTPDVMPQIEEACRSYGQAHAQDLMGRYQAEDLPDQVHPRPQAVAAYARRHYEAVSRVLAALEPEGRRP